jgi:hypothetical protein
VYKLAHTRCTCCNPSFCLVYSNHFCLRITGIIAGLLNYDTMVIDYPQKYISFVSLGDSNLNTYSINLKADARLQLQHDFKSSEINNLKFCLTTWPLKDIYSTPCSRLKCYRLISNHEYLREEFLLNSRMNYYNLHHHRQPHSSRIYSHTITTTTTTIIIIIIIIITKFLCCIDL